MKRTWNLLASLLGLAVVGAVVVSLVLIFRSQGSPPAPQQPSSRATATVLSPLPTPLPTVLTPEPPPSPTSTLPPSPTPLPTLTPAPTWTPVPGAAGAILYRRTDPEGPAIYQLRVDAAGKSVAPTARISGTLGLGGPLFPSPDGKHVAMISPSEGGWAVFMLDVTSGQIAPLLGSFIRGGPNGPGLFYNWHPDSRHVLYRPDWTLDLWLVDSQGGDHQRLSELTVDGAAISPDGRTLAYGYNKTLQLGQIWLANADGSQPRLIVEGGTADVFSWSLNGAYLVYIGEPHTGKGPSTPGSLLWIMDANGQNRRPLSAPFLYGWGFSPVWSPDSQWLAVTGQDAGQSFGCDVQAPPDPETCVFEGTAIYIENIITGEVRRLASGIEPAWSPDSSMIAFASKQSGTSEIWVINADGTGLRQLTNEGKPVRYPVWLQQ